MSYIKRKKYGAGSFLKDNAGAIGSGVGAGVGIGLAALTGGATTPLIAPLTTLGGSVGANIQKDSQQQQSMSQLPMNTLNQNQYNPFEYGGFIDDNLMEEYKNGGTIHINPKNRGKFNALKKRTGKSTEELTHSKNPLTRKRAIFAQNAAKWKHGDGGSMYAEGGELQNSDTFNEVPVEAQSHENSSLGGVPIAQNSLVEGGEYIFTDPIDKSRYVIPNKEGFSKQAKHLEKKFKNWQHDKVVRDDFHNSLRDLRGQVENWRNVNGFNNNPDVQQFNGTNGTQVLPPVINDETTFDVNPNITTFNSNTLDLPNKIDLTSTNNNWSPKLDAIGSKGSNGQGQIKSDFWSLKNPNVGAAIAGVGANAIGLLTTKEAPVNYQRVKENPIDLSREREVAKNRANTSRLINQRNLRNISTNAGEYLSSIGAINPMVDEVLGNQLAQSYQNEATYNAGDRSKVGMANADIAMKEAEARQMEKDAVRSQRLAFTQGALNSLSQLGSNYQQDKTYTDYLNSLKTNEYTLSPDKNTKFTGESKAFKENGGYLSIYELLKSKRLKK